MTTINKFILKGLWLPVVVFTLRYFLFTPGNIYDYFSAIGESVSISVILLTLYEKILWKYNSLEKTPKIFGVFTGTIEYEYNGERSKKDISIVIKQSLLTTRVKITTNETTSYTIASNLIEENGEYILYYTYITNPKSKFSSDNPIHHGTCRLDLTDKDDLHGIYWTSQKTKGDIYFKRNIL